DHDVSVLGREAVKPRESAEDFLRAGHVQRAGRIQEIDLRVDVKKNRGHGVTSWRTRKSSFVSSGLSSTGHGSFASNKLWHAAGSRASEAAARSRAWAAV